MATFYDPTQGKVVTFRYPEPRKKQVTIEMLSYGDKILLRAPKTQDDKDKFRPFWDEASADRWVGKVVCLTYIDTYDDTVKGYIDPDDTARVWWDIRFIELLP